MEWSKISGERKRPWEENLEKGGWVYLPPVTCRSMKKIVTAPLLVP